MKKIPIILTTILCFIFLMALAFFQNTVPDKFGEKEFPKLDKKVEVTFDKFGIPHINAQTDLDGYRVLGYVTASERLFQLDLMRRIISGRLSEIFGDKTLEADKLLKKLYLKDIAIKQYNIVEADQNNSEVISFAKAYLEGIHHYIETQPLPIEFILLDYVPEKFEIQDILAVPGYMALTFAEGVMGDVFFSEMIDRLPEDKMQLLRGGAEIDFKYFNKTPLPSDTSTVLNQFNLGIEQISSVFPLFHGSNSWVLSGSRTKSGYPILANDPHIATSAPHILYEAHLKTPNIEIYGHYIPLIPFPVMGHTKQSAWGMTMSQADDLNVYLEKINPQDPTQIMFKNEWQALISEDVKIKVKGSQDVTVERAMTSHGPLLNGTQFGIEGKSLSLNWSVYNYESNILKSLFDLAMAETVDEFKNAISLAAAPGLNMSWVNKQGDIAWWMLGKNPKLPDGVATDVVLKGWDGSSEMERYYTIDENPHEVNPISGVIVSANFKPMLKEFENFDGYWQPGGRYFRISSLLEKQQSWSLEELKKIQTDNIVPVYDLLVPELTSAINRSDLNEFEQKVLDQLKTWDGSTDKSSVGSSIYHTLNYFVISNAFLDELGEDGFKIFGRTADFWHSYKRLVKDLKHSFWDNISTNRVESGEEILLKSFKETVSDLKEKLGNRISLWHWGKLHTVEYEHILGKLKPLNYIYNIGPVPASGGRYVINNQGHRKSLNDYRVVHSPATRRLIDMKDPLNTIGIIPTGNSGNPFSTHYKDQLELFHAGEYRAQIMDWNVLDKMDKLIFKSN